MSVNFEDEASENQPSEGQLTRISRLATLQLALERDVEKAEKALKDAKARLRKVQEEDLPQAILEARLSKVALEDGSEILVKEDITMSVPKDPEKFAQVVKWLMDAGLTSLISENVVVRFGKNEHEQVAALLALLENSGFTNFEDESNVNTASLKAAVKELMAAGKDVPLDLLGAFQWRKAIIKAQ